MSADELEDRAFRNARHDTVGKLEVLVDPPESGIRRTLELDRDGAGCARPGKSSGTPGVE